MEEVYLDLKELCFRIKYKPQSVYNNIYRGVFVQGKHFIKPSKRKLLFKWSGIREWLGDPDNFEPNTLPVTCETVTRDKEPKSLIAV